MASFFSFFLLLAVHSSCHFFLSFFFKRRYSIFIFVCAGFSLWWVGLLSSCRVRASPCCVVSYRRAQGLGAGALVVVVPGPAAAEPVGLSLTGDWAPCPLHWQVDPQGSPLCHFLTCPFSYWLTGIFFFSRINPLSVICVANSLNPCKYFFYLVLYLLTFVVFFAV